MRDSSAVKVQTLNSASLACSTFFAFLQLDATLPTEKFAAGVRSKFTDGEVKATADWTITRNNIHHGF